MMIKMFQKKRFVKNKTSILAVCSSYIDIFEKEILENHFYPSCKDILLKEIDAYLAGMYNQVVCFDEKIDNFTEIAVAFISTRSFEFFEYGWFRVGQRYQSYSSSSGMMAAIHNKAIQWGVDHGFTTEEEQKEDALALQDAMRQVL